jgi:hypothetical protein
VQESHLAYVYTSDDPVNEVDPTGMMGGGPGEFCSGEPGGCHFGYESLVPSWVRHHWRGMVTVVGVVAGLAAAATGVGALADATILGADAGLVSATASVVASGADLPACVGGSATSCASAAASLLAGGLGYSAFRIASVNEILMNRGFELSVLRGIAPGLLDAKAFAIGTGSLFWDFLDDLAHRHVGHHG